MGQILVLIIVVIVWGIAAWAKQASEARERERRRGPGAPPPPPPASGLDEIRRFLREISEPSPREAPPTPSEPPREAPPTQRRAGRPPTRRAVTPTAPRAGRPPARAPVRPRAMPQPVAAPARPARPPAARPRVTALTEERVREGLHVEEVSQEAESLARRAERLVSVAPRELITVTPAVQAEIYEGLQQTRRRSLTEVAQNLRHPLARAIIFQEVVGPPLALRRPERTLADQG